jgi:hypothetical protein
LPVRSTTSPADVSAHPDGVHLERADTDFEENECVSTAYSAERAFAIERTTMKDANVPGDLDSMRSFLREQAARAPARAGSRYEMVELLLPEILVLKGKRYTDAEIRDLLCARGMDMSVGTFRRYVQRAQRGSSGASERTRTVRKADTDAVDHASLTPEPQSLTTGSHEPAKQGKVALSHHLNRKL